MTEQSTSPALPEFTEEVSLLTFSPCGRQDASHDLTGIDPDTLEGHRVHHKIEFELLEKVFERISGVEGKIFPFSFELSDDGEKETFLISKSMSARLGMNVYSISGEYTSVYPRILKSLQGYLKNLDNPS